MRRAIAIALLLCAGVALVCASQALAGSDIYSNIAPGAHASNGGLADRYPLGHFALDKHFKAVEASLTGGVDVSGVPAMLAHFLATVIWGLTALLASTLIDLFTFAFSLDLVGGSHATGGVGALEPVARAIRALYAHTFGEPWLVVAIVLVGLWALWRGLVQRRYTETAGALATSLVFLVIAMAFVTQPERTIGEASRWTNQMSAAFLALSSGGSVTDEQQAKRAASDQLFSLLVFEPWVVLNFGGLEHCVRAGTGDKDSDPQSLPVRPLSHNPGRDRTLRDRLHGGVRVQADGGKTCLNNRRKYAARFLRYGPGTEARDAAYEALNDGDTDRLPETERSDAYRLGPEDKPATDAMEREGQFERLLMATVIFAGALGAFLLLGALAVGVILAQVMLLLLFAFAPVALVIGIFPGRGHDFFAAWLIRLAGFLVRKAIYSLILAVLLTVCAAVGDATGYLGWLLSFGLQAAFFWAVLIWRRQLTGQLLTATTGAAARTDARSALESLYYARSLLRRARRTHHGQSPPPPPPPRGQGGRGPNPPAGPGPRTPRRPTQPAGDKPRPSARQPAHARQQPAPARPTAAHQDPHDPDPASAPAKQRRERQPDQPRASHRTQRDPEHARPSGTDTQRPDPAASDNEAAQAPPQVQREAAAPAAKVAPAGRGTPHSPALDELADSPFSAGAASNPLLTALRRDRERLAPTDRPRRRRRSTPASGGNRP